MTSSEPVRKRRLLWFSQRRPYRCPYNGAPVDFPRRSASRVRLAARLSGTTAAPGEEQAPNSKTPSRTSVITSDTRVCMACETIAVRRIRQHFLEDRGLQLELTVTCGYWRLGLADYTTNRPISAFVYLSTCSEPIGLEPSGRRLPEASLVCPDRLSRSIMCP